MDDFKAIYNDLIQQSQKAWRYKKYYTGDQPLMYSHERLRQVFKVANIQFIQNWCGVVVNAVLDRLEFNGWDDPNETISTNLNQFYRDQRLNILSREVHKDALVTGDGFVMLDNIQGKIMVYANSPEMVAVRYKEDMPDEMDYGIKMWYDWREKLTCANLYYPDVIEKYKANGVPSESSVFEKFHEVVNPFRRIPIIHFRAENTLADIITLQDAINKTFSDMMVVAEFNAFKQRWMITNADISSLVASPQSIMQIPKGMSDEESTQIGEFTSADLGMYLDTMDKLANSIAVISRIPKHYFVATGSALSGEALIAMEAPLVKKVAIQAQTLGQGWREVASFVGGTHNTVPIWSSFQTEQPESVANSMRTLVSLGIPVITVLRRYGWDDSEIEQYLADKEQERLTQAEVAASALEMALIRSSQSNNPLV